MNESQLEQKTDLILGELRKLSLEYDGRLLAACCLGFAGSLYHSLIIARVKRPEDVAMEFFAAQVAALAARETEAVPKVMYLDADGEKRTKQ